MIMEVERLTKEYIAAFNSKNIEAVDSLFSNDICLTDPGVFELTPKSNVMVMIKKYLNRHQINSHLNLKIFLWTVMFRLLNLN